MTFIKCLCTCTGKCEKYSDGTCPDPNSHPCSHCLGVISPVCGKDGKTYDNYCLSECLKVPIENHGPCPKKVVKPQAVVPCQAPDCYQPMYQPMPCQTPGCYQQHVQVMPTYQQAPMMKQMNTASYAKGQASSYSIGSSL